MDEELNLESPSLDLQTLKTISVLGRGAKGIAFLIRNEKQTLALKVISKSSIESKRKNEKKEGEEEIDHYKRIWFERDVLNCFDHPLLPRLRGVVNTEDIIGFAIDYCSGGDLNSLRKQQTERMFSNDVIRFYAVELVLVLEYLHSLGIIYRDLKPENILIQENGHLMIVDFDLSTKLSSPSRSIKLKQQSTLPESSTVKRKKKRRISGFLLYKCNSESSQVDLDESTVVETETESVEKSRSFVGTEDYVAPEIIIGNGHDFSVDWWSLGVVLYEMLYGKTPFRGANRKETFYRILSKSPELVGEQTELRDLIGKLLVKEPANRISVEEIKNHNYFKGVDWDSILEISRPPHIPPMKWDDENDLEEIDGIDLKLVVEGLIAGDENKNVVEKEKISSNIEKNNKNAWVDGLRSSYTDDDFLNVF